MCVNMFQALFKFLDGTLYNFSLSDRALARITGFKDSGGRRGGGGVEAENF